MGGVTRRPKMPREDAQAICDAYYGSAISIPDLADQMGIPRATVGHIVLGTKHWKRLRRPPRAAAMRARKVRAAAKASGASLRKLSDDDVHELRDRWCRRVDLAAIAEREGVTVRTVIRWFQGIPSRTRSAAHIDALRQEYRRHNLTIRGLVRETGHSELLLRDVLYARRAYRKFRMTKTDAGSTVVPFGQYKGQTIEKMCSTPEGLVYADWQVGVAKSKAYVDALSTYLALPDVARDLDAALAEQDSRRD